MGVDCNLIIKGYWSNFLLMFDLVISIIENDFFFIRFSFLRYLLFCLFLSIKIMYYCLLLLNCLFLCNVIYYIEFIIVLFYYFFF